MSIEIIPFADCDPLLDWRELAQELEAGHNLPRADVADTFLYRGQDTLLNRSAWIDGLGLAIKAATIFPANKAANKPAINGGVNLFSDKNGTLEAVIDFHLVTKWKTAGDSVLAAMKLARADSRNVLIVGAGTVARTLHAAYGAAFPDAKFTIWNRSRDKAVQLAADTGMDVADDLEQAVRQAEIITCATMTTTPVIRGNWLQPGQHVDLIGAYRPDMREADDVALQRARLFMDTRATVLGHIGEFKIPLETGAISENDVVADYYDLPGGKFARQSGDEITLFKNGGGAHLDLMTCRYILKKWNER